MSYHLPPWLGLVALVALLNLVPGCALPRDTRLGAWLRHELGLSTDIPIQLDYSGIRVVVIDDSNGMPLDSVTIGVRYSAATWLHGHGWLGIGIEEIWRVVFDSLYSADSTGTCDIGPLRVKRKAHRAGGYSLFIDEGSHVPVRADVPRNQAPRVLQPYVGPATRNTWDSRNKTFCVWLQRRDGYLNSNNVADLFVDGDYVWVGSRPLQGNGGWDRVWSRYKRSTGIWDRFCAAPSDPVWRQARARYHVPSSQTVQDVDRTAWRVVRESLDVPPPAAPLRLVLLHTQQDTSAILSRVALPHLSPHVLPGLAVTASDVWVWQSGHLLRFGKTSGALKELGEECGLKGRASVVAADTPYLWIGTYQYGVNRLDLRTGSMEYFTY
jgi:hypothetical protein